MINIVIVGCGEFGSRHLQALSLLQESTKIHLIDNSEKALNTTLDRFNDVYDKASQSLIEVRICRNLTDVRNDIDVAIVATGSESRLAVITDLLNIISPKYIILEKFLFQKSDYFSQAQLLINKSNTKVYVNQWLSSDYLFSRVKNWFDNFNQIKMKVSGGNWGLSCNSIHFVDSFESLVSEGINKTFACLNRVYPSKRSGYYELNGSISLTTETGSELTLISEDISTDDINILIESRDKKVHMVLKPNQQVFINFNDSKGQFNEVGRFPLQSSMTQTIVQELMLYGDCKLPSYETSSRQHLLLLPIFDKFIRDEIGWNKAGCPIT